MQNSNILEFMQKEIIIKTKKWNELCDITDEVGDYINSTGVQQGVINIYVQGATAGIMIQENWDESVQTDVISLLKKIIPQGVWEHDKQDNNGAAHLKSGIIGPSETIPIINGKLGLSTWQNIFLCEFDGPRAGRKIILTIFKQK